MYFIVVYNRTTGYTDKILSQADPDKAFKLFQDKEYEYQDNKDISVNYVTADNEADLRKYWCCFITRDKPLELR
jgi:hypothetical protein